uniref:Uncharacterized protein n=1 Tax=Anguilla anguilla TaxID=7936 RepID=A0A0E9WXJ1_ANGAN
MYLNIKLYLLQKESKTNKPTKKKKENRPISFHQLSSCSIFTNMCCTRQPLKMLSCLQRGNCSVSHDKEDSATSTTNLEALKMDGGVCSC